MEVLLPVECPCHPVGASTMKHKELNVLFDFLQGIDTLLVLEGSGNLVLYSGVVRVSDAFPIPDLCAGNSGSSMALMGTMTSFLWGLFSEQNLTLFWFPFSTKKVGKVFIPGLPAPSLTMSNPMPRPSTPLDSVSTPAKPLNKHLGPLEEVRNKEIFLLL